MTITQANLRVATPEESAYARGGFLYRSISSPIWCYLQRCGAKELAADKSNYFLYGQPPALLRVWTSVKSIFGYGDDILTRYPCTNFDRVDTDKRKISEAILKHHRNGEIFIPSKGMKAFEIFLQECFPGITSNDLILSCEKKETKFFHKILSNILQPKRIKDYLPTIREECEASFNEIEEGEQTNATKQVSYYFTRIFGQNIFNNSESGMKLNGHLTTFKQLISRQACNQSTPEDANIKRALIHDIVKTTSEILTENPDLFLAGESKGEKPLSNEAKCALLFLVIFAANDNTTTTLSAALWYLAVHPHEQEELRKICQEYQQKPNEQYPEQLNDFLLKIIQQFPPVTGITRTAAQDLCLEYTLESDNLTRKALIFKDEIVVARTDKIAKKNLLDQLSFGYGLHKCPGMHYAQAAIKEFIIHTLANYQIELASPAELKLKLAFTAVLENDVEVIFNKL